MSLYDRIAARPGGTRGLAAARLKREVLASLHQAFALSGMGSQSELARRLNVRRSAVNQVFNGDGNLRITTIAEYLHEMGYELNVTLVRAGEPRSAAVEGRDAQPALPAAGTAAVSTLYFQDTPQALVEQPTTPYLILRAPVAQGMANPVTVRSWASKTVLEQAVSCSLATPIPVNAPEGRPS
jgi:transcriptional regulator with XRE-family HTH domain